MTGQTYAETPTAASPRDPTATGVVLVDARPDRRAVLRTVIDHSDVAATVVAEVDSQADAVNAVEQHAADMVIIDFQRPVQDGLDAVALLRARFPALVILVCSFNGDPELRRSALAEGADGYLLKPVSARQVMAAMRGVPPRVNAMQ